MSFFSGSPGGFETLSTLTPDQQGVLTQLLNSIKGKGAGGAFGAASDYYQDILGNSPEQFDAFARPEMRRFQQEIIPGLAEQFAGMGSGGLSSSGFRNASTQAGTDLSERLGQIRAQLRQNAAQGLQNLGQQGLGQFQENIYQPGTPGAGGAVGGLLGGLAGSFLGPMGMFAGAGLGNKLFGSSDPYGGAGGGYGNSTNAALGVR